MSTDGAGVQRRALIDALRAAMEPHAWIHAAWLGGSEATGRTDALSDVDLQVVVDPEHEEALFELAEAVLDDLGGIERRWRAPAPPGAPYAQRFYLPRDAPEHRMLDLCAMRAQHLAPYLDPRRHGVPVIWFDRAGLLQPVEDHGVVDRCAVHLAQLQQRLPMLAHIVDKELQRGDLFAAVAFYHQLLLRGLVDLLRIRHCPARFDFGSRYLERDLPPAVRARLGLLLLPKDAAQLARHTKRVRAWIAEELQRAGDG